MFVEPDTTELPGESPEGHVIAQSTLDFPSIVCNEWDMERAGMASNTSPDLEVAPEESGHNSDTKDEAATKSIPTAKGDNGEVQVKKSKSQMRKDRERKRAAAERARVQAAADPSIAGQSALSDSTSDETAKQSATSGSKTIKQQQSVLFQFSGLVRTVSRLKSRWQYTVGMRLGKRT
jgi:hypothetical protein